MRGGAACWLLVQRAAVLWGRWWSRLAVAVLRWFLLSKEPIPDFLPVTIIPCIFIHIPLVCVCVFVC